MAQARQQKRFTPVHSGLKWQTLQRLAAGCQGDYITSSNESSSLRISQALVTDTDPMDVLEAGFPVMFYNPKSKSFQNRVVKVDRQLSFFFVLEERQLKQPVAVRLYEIDEVLSSTQAFEILAEFNLQDEYATEKTTTVIIHTRPTKETALTLDKLLILLAPPAMKLHEHIAACVELSKSKFSADAGDEEGVRLKDSGRYLDCARIGSCGPVFFHYATGVDLEFTLRAADVVEKQEFEPKQPITHALHFPMDATTVGTEIDKLVERLGILPALDLTRLRLVVYEMVLHRQWISPNIRLFAGGMYDFMQDQGGIAACFKVPIELRQKLFEGIPAPRRKMDVHYYSHCALDATILALKHLLSLEDVHQPLEELRKGMEELEKGARDDRAAELREALRTAPLSTQPDEGILQRVRQLASSEEASAEGRNSRHSLLAFSEEGFHDDAVPSRRRLSSYHMMAETMELEPSRRNSLVTFSETESGAGAAGPPRRQRLSSYGMFAEQTERISHRSTEISDFKIQITEPGQEILEI